MHTSPGKRLTSAIGAALSVATLTAFAVAPLTEEPPPHARIIEPVTLKPEAIETTASGAFRRQVKVARGESLGSLMRKFGQQDHVLTDFIRTNPTARKMLSLQPGTPVHAELDGNNRIQTLTYPLPLTNPGRSTPQRLFLSRKSGKWTAQLQDYPLERHLVTRSAKVVTTLFSATDAAGIPSAITARIAEVFGSDIDFHREVKKGDRIRLVYEMYVDPESVSEGQPGRILAVEYLSGDKRLDALWFDRADGNGDYYSFDGQALKRRFLRSPLEYTRISSGFSLGRRHPVFRDWRVHKGVDYAAPTGTKIRTVGDGVVEYIGNQRGYGKVVIVKHDDNQSTLYAHMHRFANNLNLGDTVKQGQIIGEVGQTGWATGPHLHFEFLLNGKQIDPTTMLPQPSQPLDATSQIQLRASAEKLIDLMRWQEAVNVASFE
ncbi:MAG: peptidoglycan DD-metalloendopeptidase family protein [Lautropia sp.]|nr:peptidoglycan DD-metalloendopeptidase family protein [Lautropia sp.]